MGGDMNTKQVSPQPKSGRDKIAKLREAFFDQLPGRILIIEQLLRGLQAGAQEPAQAHHLHRAFHNLKGVAASFGCLELSQAASLSDELTAALLETKVKPRAGAPWMAEAEAQLARVKAVAARNLNPAEAAWPGPVQVGPDLSGALPGKSERTVFICDDEALVVEQLRIQIGCFGYRTAGFTEPQALYNAALECPPEAIIMDIHFPEGPKAGPEAVAALNLRLKRKVPVIFLSARDDFDARLAAVQAGGDAYFHKPARALDLIASLDELTRQKQPLPFRILSVDDDSIINGYHCAILQEAGMETREVSEPSGLLEILNDFRPDLVLMDLYMPGCTGQELAKVIRQVPDHVGLPILFLSAETDRTVQFSAMRVGVEGFLTKPVKPAELVAAVSLRAERMRILRGLMARDSLTGLFNHTTTIQLLDNALATALRKGTALSFAMLDLDNFKQVNDTYGHPAGDQVLIGLARILQQRLRHTDLIGRFGGEEFAVVMQDLAPAQAARLIDDLREAFSALVFHAGDEAFSCSFSAGLASHPGYRRLETMRDAADRALYQAKREGRNRIVVAEAGPAQEGL